ncbi:asparaginase [Mycolicibacterium sediminis]|uniref:L-asparaginase n=1 Tax=Mycolicibacterium sediminis TaxID=1286180 RepID=A0A7I7QMG1_9MYCO|nr:asparaginase [Mycolicibacterium sediminis]BBY27501.1 L-asparaginase [Mycolicibacterium sediminis]
MPHVVVLTSGGTISSRRSGDSVVAVDDASALLAGVVVDEGISVEAHEVVRVGSYRMTPSDMRAIADAVATHLRRDDVHGIVVTHGTDTLEETAILLDLVHDDPRPVALTGAQRAADVADTDGPRNIRDAITVAASADARGRGVVVVFDGSIHAARGVRKEHTVDLAAFANPAGTVGTVRTGTVRIHSTPVRPGALARPRPEFDTTRVDVVAVYPGGDDVLLRAAVGAGARGIVLVGTGLGNAPEGIARAVAEIVADGVVVALSTRVPAGPVLPVYGNGGGYDLVAAGAVPASLPPSQARIALALLLSSGATPAAVAGALGDYA